jgi:hypothetical protein
MRSGRLRLGIGRNRPQRFPPPALVRVLTAETKSVAPCEVCARTRAESTRFSKGLCALSGCGTPTNVLVAVYRRHPAHPHSLLFRGGDLVPDPLARDLPLELGE